MKIGITDSGIGGLNVLASLIKYRCGDSYLYLADGANLPYGNKSATELREIALRNARSLTERGANVIVFGCNTLSVSALDYVRKRVTPPVFGLRPHTELLAGRSLLMTTPATALFLPKIPPNVALLTPAALASLIDGEYPKTEKTFAYLRPLILPYADAQTVCLGCSHYLFAKEALQTLLPQAKITDGTGHLARLIRAVLPHNLCKNPTVDFLFTGENETDRYCRILSDLLR